jgi:flagellar biosynthesis GTPase FlhF
LHNNVGITTAINYPYSKNAYTYGKADKCVQPAANSNAVTVSSWAYAPTETAMQNYVRATGPLSVGLAADILQTYQSGVISAAACGSSKMQDHAVQMVGVDLGNGYFKIRNSWSARWGEQGFFRLQTVTGGSVNTCNIVGLYCAPGYSCPTGGTYTTMIAVKHSPAAETKGKSVSEDKKDEKMETKKGSKKAEKEEEKESKEDSKKEDKKEAKKEAKEEKKESKEEPKKMEKKEAKKEAKEPKKMGHTAGKA